MQILLCVNFLRVFCRIKDLTLNKKCSRCGEVKEASEFNKRTRSLDGLSYYCRPCNSAYLKTYCQENADRLAAYRRDRDRTSVRAFDKARRISDPLRSRLTRGAIRAKELGNTVDKFSSADLLEYWSHHGISSTLCYYTGEILRAGWHLDHKTPLSQGGPHSMDNLVPCTPSSNGAKYNRTAAQYLTLNEEI